MSERSTGVLKVAAMAIAVAALSAGTAGAQNLASADQRAMPPEEASYSLAGHEVGHDRYGTEDDVVVTIHASSVYPVYPDTTWGVTIGSWGWQKYRTGGSTAFAASLDLPEGAEIRRLELDGCDSSASAGLSLELWSCGTGSWCTPTAGPSTGVAATDGCDWWQTFLSSTVEVDNLWRSLSVRVIVGGADTNTTFHAVRVYYRLRVSPAPATASFNDVPTNHWAFQHIEALAASGITAGCGSGNYCPDSPLTRAQMAVFLAKALGLHWAP